MKKILEGSLIYRAITAAALWLDAQWSKSLLRLLFVGGDRPAMGSGIIGRLGRAVHMGLCRIFEALRLDRLFEGSVFQRSYLWMALAVLIAPIMPTMAVLAAAAVAFGSLILRFACDRELTMARSPLTKWVIGFSVIELASTFLSVTVEGSLMGGLLTTGFVLFALVVMQNCRTREDLERLLNILILSGLIVACIGILQAALGLESETAWVDEDDFSNLKLRVYSTLDNPNVLSEYLLLVIPLSAAAVYTARTPNGKLMAAMCFLAMCLCLALTYARGGYLGLIFAAAVFLVILDRRFIVLGLLGLLALPAVMPMSIINRFASIGDMGDSSTSYRVYIWMASLDMLKDYWLTGFGTGVAAFQRVYPRYSFNAVSAPHAHNLYLQIFCESGIAGIGMLLGSICSCVRCLSRAISRGDKRLRVQAAAVMAGLGGFCVQAMTDHAFYNYRVTLMFWVLAGVAGAIGMMAERGGGEAARG